MVVKWKKYCHEKKFCHEEKFFNEKKFCHDKTFFRQTKFCHGKKFCHVIKILCREERISLGRKIIIGVPKIRFCCMKNVLFNSNEKC